MTKQMKKWIEKQEKKIEWNIEFNKLREEKLAKYKEEYKDLENIPFEKFMSCYETTSKMLKNIPEHIAITDGMIMVYYDKDFNVIEYGIDKKEIKKEIDVIKWTKHLSGKQWTNNSIIYEFINICSDILNLGLR